MRIFISSVIKDFENFRKMAAKAVGLVNFTPIMMEQSSAKALSSEQACLLNVEEADIYLLIMGSRYGFLNHDGFSVTHLEYLHARKMGKPILAFVFNGEMEVKQLNFKKEVENFSNGHFRANFSTPEELKDEVIKALSCLKLESNASSQKEFQQIISTDYRSGISRKGYSEPGLMVSFWKQPKREVDIFEIESNLDEIFNKLAKNNIVSLRNGFKSEKGGNWTGLKSEKFESRFFDNGLNIYYLNPTLPDKDSLGFSSFYISPSHLKVVLNGILKVHGPENAWVQISLDGMNNASIGEPVKTRGGGVMLPSRYNENDNFYKIEKLFLPFNLKDYENWVDQQVKMMERKFSVGQR